MTVPNIPIKRTTDWDRRTAEAVNYLLNIQEYISVDADGIPSAGQELLSVKFPFTVSINESVSGLTCDTAPTADAVFNFTIAGASAGIATIPAGQKIGVFALTTTNIPAWTRFIVTAPSPADASMADITLALAI